MRSLFRFKSLALVGIGLLCVILPLRGQQSAEMSPQESMARLTPEEHQKFDAAATSYKANKYGDSLALYQELLKAHPDDPLLTKYAAESALNAKKTAYVIEVLQPLVMAHLEDWQASIMLARAYAETGDKEKRDREMMHLAMLQTMGRIPKGMNQYLVETVADGDNQIMIFNSFVPYSGYNVYNYARVLDKQGRLLLRLTVESSDFEQTKFAKEHPAEAAAGERAFSLDGYRTDPGQNGGEPTDTHFTFSFFTGRPHYEQIRGYFLEIAEGKRKAISSRSGLPIPK